MTGNVTEHFTWHELLRSATAERYPRLRQQQFNPPDAVVENLRYLAETVLEPIRQRLGYPIRVTSGYRSPGVNKRVGGSKTSQHLSGQAADIQLGRAFLETRQAAAIRAEAETRIGRPWRKDLNANFYLFAAIVLKLDAYDVDQVIHEYGDGPGRPAWVHVAASTARDRRQVLVVGHHTGKRYMGLTRDAALALGV